MDHTVQQLLELEKDLHVKSPDFGRTLLVIAAKGYKTIGDKLLDAGADVNYRSESADFRYAIPLCAAASKGYEEILNKLLNAGADVNVS